MIQFEILISACVCVGPQLQVLRLTCPTLYVYRVLAKSDAGRASALNAQQPDSKVLCWRAGGKKQSREQNLSRRVNRQSYQSRMAIGMASRFGREGRGCCPTFFSFEPARRPIRTEIFLPWSLYNISKCCLGGGRG